MTLDRREALATIACAAMAPGALAAATTGGGTIAVGRVTLEWRSEAVGIDTVRPRFGWSLVPAGEKTRGLMQTMCHVIVATDRADAHAARGTLWDSGPRQTPDQLFRPERDLPIQTHGEYWWAVRVADNAGRWSDWSSPARVVAGVLDQAHWPDRWLAACPDPVIPRHAAGQARADMVPAKPLPIFRRELQLAALPTRATLSIAGLGQYALMINERPVGDAALASGWTNYHRSVLYDTFDVTALLNQGRNVLALMLGNGMYNVEYKAGRYTKFLDTFGSPKAILRLTIHDAVGRETVFLSDADWRSCNGPIRFSSIYGGEDVDARDDPVGWQRAGFDDRHWTPGLMVAGPGGSLRASGIPPVRVARTLAPVSASEPGLGVTVFDFGENFSGRPTIELVAAAGTTCILTPGEALDSHGRVSQKSFNAEPDRATLFCFTTAGRGTERFSPRFTYHGFRYIEVTGVARSAIRAISADFLQADCANIGSFASGEPLLDKIHALINQAVSSNMMSVLTDCPQREKLGWLEQTYLNAPTVLYNRDAISLYEKLVDDIAEAQQPDGMVPGIAPEYVAFVDEHGDDQIWRNSPEWGAAAILSPWAAYRFYGDATILRTAYPAAQRYIAYLERRADQGLIDFGMGDWYDIGPKDSGPAQLTSRMLTGTALFQEILTTMACIAPLVGRARDAGAYRERADAVARAFNARFLDRARASYDRGSQTALAMPLALGIVPEPLRAQVATALVASVRRERNGVTAGDIGFRYVLDALADVGRDDVVLEMLRVTDRPSYGYQIAHGATALTEAWDANPDHSLNHFMLGHAEGWLYRRLGGLQIDHAKPGAKALTIAPQVQLGVGRASASYQTRSGLLRCAWEITGEWLKVAFSVPPGREATINLSFIDPDHLLKGNTSIARSRSTRNLSALDDGISFVVGSGDYTFDAPIRF